MTRFLTKRNIAIILGILLVALIVGYGEYRRYTLTNQITQKFQGKVYLLEAEIAAIRSQNNYLTQDVATTKNQSTLFQEQIGSVTNTVGTINKLSKIDPQLLQKYSKVYFLSENYSPKSFATITPEFLLQKDKQLTFLTEAYPYLLKLLQAAVNDGIPLQIISAYRSFGAQTSLKSSYKVTYGGGTANSFSADQGYSEHQLGTTVDFTTPDVGDTFIGFEKTKTFNWLTQNAYRFGFVLSYPIQNTYYQFEPWHWRFVGVDLATRLHNQGKYFYDLDQRTINDYLLVLFD